MLHAEVGQHLRAEAEVAQLVLAPGHARRLLVQHVRLERRRAASARPRDTRRAGRRARRARSPAAPPRSCAPQSHAAEPKTSPGKHAVCTRTSTGSRRADVAERQRQILGLLDRRRVDVARGSSADTPGSVGASGAAAALLDERLAAAADTRSGRRSTGCAARAAAAKLSRSGMRAIVPSSFMISQITPAGDRPGQARQIDRALGLPGAHQHAAALGAQRKHVARRDQILGARVAASTAVRIVVARSLALMPVVTPWRASMRHRERGAERRAAACAPTAAAARARPPSPRSASGR